MKKIMFVLGGGGHSTEMIELLNLLGPNYKYEYVLTSGDKLTKAKLRYQGRIFRITKPREIKDNKIIASLKLIVATIEAFSIIAKSRSKTIISSGPGISIPVFFWAKLFGKKTIFVETISRVYTKSLAGKLAYPFSNVFFVQWPELKKKYPKSIYAGRLL